MDFNYSIKVYKEYFNFASSHFLVFENGTREPLHGHNYRVMLKGETSTLKGDMVFDFLDIKPIVRDICNSLDHKVLIPKLNPQIRIDDKGKNLEIRTPDESFFSIPKDDILLLPIENTSAERLAIYLCEEIKKSVFNKYSFKFATLEIEVEETRGQSAIYLFKEPLA